jgi:hypothetical protein
MDKYNFNKHVKTNQMKITLTPQESEEYFFNALCNGLSYIEGYGLSIDFNATEYREAKDKLKSPCYEDVFMQLLRDGNNLTLVDEEGEGDMTRSINLKDVHERVQNTPLRHLMAMIDEEDDADTADAILQTVFFSDIIFG